jgi:hypothetical protein
MLHGSTCPHFMSCNETTKNVNHYICNTTFNFQRDTKFKALLGTSQHVMLHESTRPRFKSCNVATKYFQRYICKTTTHIFFTVIRNEKLVTAHRCTSQLVIPHEFAHPRFNSCKMMTKYFVD